MSAVLLALLIGAAEPDPQCGSYCLYVALEGLDIPVGDHADLEEKLGPPEPHGYSMGELEEAAQSYGAQTLAVETSLSNLLRRPGRFVCIAHLDGNHFVLLEEIDGREQVMVVDPPGRYTLPPETLATRWQGTALLISPDPLLAEEDLPRPFPWQAIAWGVAGAACLVGLVWSVRRARRSD